MNDNQHVRKEDNRRTMNYKESRAYIRDAEKKKGIVLGLDNMRELMRRLGDPQDELKYVHVAGTNGKGSVIAYLYSALSGTGYRVGSIYFPGCLFLQREDGSKRRACQQGEICSICDEDRGGDR